REAISGIFFTLFFDLPFIIIFIIAIALISNIYLAMLPFFLLLLLYFSALFFKKCLKHSSENMPSIYYRYQNFLLESFNQLFALKALGAGSTWKKRQQ